MKLSAAGEHTHPDFRPWYREPWVWLLIALPAIAVVGCAITIWLAISQPDYLVVDEQEYQQLQADLHAGETERPAATSQSPAASAQHKSAAGRDNDDG